MTNFHNWTGDEEIAEQVPQFLNDDNAATLEKLDTKFNNSLKITGAADLNSFKDEGLYYCNSNSQAETILNCPTNYAFGLMVWGKEDILYQEVREFNRGSNQDYNNCWRRSYYSEGGQGVWSNWQQMSYVATTLAGYGITDGMSKTAQNSVSTENIMKRNVNNSSLRLMGGINVGSGASLQLCGSALTGTEGHFSLMAVDSAQSATLKGSPSGLLKWNNKNIVRSINNVAADENGNVNIVVGGGGSGGGSNITVDAEISSTSTNPVQNKAIYNALLNKVGTEDIFNGFILRSPTASIMWRIGSQTLGSLTASNYTGTSLRATQDSDGNIINTTYAKKSDISGMVKSVNNVKPDSNGNVNITVSGGGSNITVDAELSTTSTNAIQNKAVAAKFNDLTVAFDSKANIVDLADVATSGQYHDLKNTPTVDITLSSTSTNAIANKAVYDALQSKLGKNDNVATATRALQDAQGNIISSTYIKFINGVGPDTSGNVNVSTGGGGVSTSVANTWTAQQNFQRLKFNFENFATSRISGTYDSPATSVATYNVTGALTLDMSTLTGMLANGESTLFTAYIASNASYALSITNAGTLKYVGSAADLAITSSGLLLNVLLTKNASGAVTSIAQASKLS